MSITRIFEAQRQQRKAQVQREDRILAEHAAILARRSGVIPIQAAARRQPPPAPRPEPSARELAAALQQADPVQFARLEAGETVEVTYDGQTYQLRHGDADRCGEGFAELVSAGAGQPSLALAPRVDGDSGEGFASIVDHLTPEPPEAA